MSVIFKADLPMYPHSVHYSARSCCVISWCSFICVDLTPRLAASCAHSGRPCSFFLLSPCVANVTSFSVLHTETFEKGPPSRSHLSQPQQINPQCPHLFLFTLNLSCLIVTVDMSHDIFYFLSDWQWTGTCCNTWNHNDTIKLNRQTNLRLDELSWQISLICLSN